MPLDPLVTVQWVIQSFPAPARSSYPRWYIVNVSHLSATSAARILKSVYIVHAYLKDYLGNKWDRLEIIQVQQEAVQQIATSLGPATAGCCSRWELNSTSAKLPATVTLRYPTDGRDVD